MLLQNAEEQSNCDCKKHVKIHIDTHNEDTALRKIHILLCTLYNKPLKPPDQPSPPRLLLSLNNHPLPQLRKRIKRRPRQPTHNTNILITPNPQPTRQMHRSILRNRMPRNNPHRRIQTPHHHH